MRSLVLLGHGSVCSSESAQPIYSVADLLRGQALFGEVVTGFWQEEPSLRQVLKTVQFTDVTVIPMLLSEGELSETVWPRELGLGHQGAVPPQGVTRMLSGLSVHYTRPYGTHPAMQQVIMACAQEVLAQHSAANNVAVGAGAVGVGMSAPTTQHTALLLVAFEESGASQGNLLDIMQQHAQALRQHSESQHFGAVEAILLPTQKPVGLPPALPSGVQRVVAVPFMQELGPHKARLEAYLAHYERKSQVQVYTAQPVGQHPTAAQVVIEVAAQARTPLGGDLERGYQERWGAVFALAANPLRIGELLISPHGALIELRHALDEGRHTDSLQTLVTLSGLRQQVRCDAAGRYRPLSTLRTLPLGWRAVLLRRDLPAALQAVYPGVIEEGFAHHHHALRATPWAATTRRQTGALVAAQQATSQQVEQAARKLCSACLKTRLWASEPLHQTFLGGVPGAIPCAEACLLLVTQVGAAATSATT